MACKGFGRECFDTTAYVTFQDNAGMAGVFEGSLDPSHLLDAIAVETDIRPNEGTLVIFHEIQKCPRAITSLKMVQEQVPDSMIVAACSLLGIALHQSTSFPVGKADHLSLHPLSFGEFLLAPGLDKLADLLERQDVSLVDSFSEKLTDALRGYYYVGGMPEAVSIFAESGDFEAVRRVQENLLFA